MLWWLLQNAVVALALAGLVRLICLLWRVDPVARHALWLIVLIKLVTPPLVAWPWAVPDGWQKQAPVVSVAVSKPAAVKAPAHSSAEVAIVEQPNGESDIVEIGPEVEPTVVGAGDPMPMPAPQIVEKPAIANPPAVSLTPASVKPIEPAPSRLPVLLRRGAMGIWLGGSILFLLVHMVRILRMMLRLGQPASADAALQQRTELLCQRLGIRPVPVHLISGMNSPCIWALVRPTLLWPAELSLDLPDRALDGVIVHELAHVRRRDHWIGWVELLAGFIWWWNPLFWYVRQQVRENAELACDAWVVDTIPTGRRAYAEALLAVCEQLTGRPVPALAVGARMDGRRFLERRLAMILREHFPLRLRPWRLCAILLLGLTSLPAWSQTTPPGAATGPGAGATPAAKEEAVVFEEGGLARMMAGAATGPNSSQLPQEAADIIEQFKRHQESARRQTEEKIARQRSEVVDSLARMATVADATGLSAQAHALREAIDALKFPAPASTPIPDPGTLMAYRGQPGKNLLIEVTGQSDGRIWGSGIYTDDSPLATAAVHAGVLKPGEKGVVRITIQPGLPAYEGSTQNGVESNIYGPWEGSYTIGKELTSPQASRGIFLHGAEMSGMVRTLRRSGVSQGHSISEYRDRVSQIFTFEAVGSDQGTIWGDMIYTDDSPLGTAAVHAGVLKPGERGAIVVQILPGQTHYGASTANGISSQSWEGFPGSYRILRKIARAVMREPGPGGMSPQGSALRGAGGPGIVPQVPSPEFAPVAPESDQVKPGLPIGAFYIAEITGSTNYTVWGDGIYTTDSSLSAAAVHAGIVKEGEKATVIVTILAGQDHYDGSTRNGVTSRPWGGFSSSFVIQKAPAASQAPPGGPPKLPETSGPGGAPSLPGSTATPAPGGS